MKKEDIKELREFLTGNLAKYKKHNRKGLKNHIKLDIEKEILQEILFEDNKIALPDNLWKLLDLSDVSFDGIDVEEVNFAGSKGVVINPQK